MTFPIKEVPEWYVLDSSKSDTFDDCRRLYFYTHILGWRSETPMHDAYFGESWHKSREYMLLHGYDDIEGAYRAFLKHYRLKFPEETDELYRPKNPEAAFLGIFNFSNNEERRHDLERNKVLFTEISGTVPIDERRILHFRMDSILENIETGMIFSWDHKSTKSFSRFWRDTFFLCTQNFTYTHCLYCMYPVERVKGVEFCGASFEFLSRNSKIRKAGYHVNFERVPAWKTPEQMNASLWDTIDRYNELEREMDRLSHCTEGDTVLQCFPKNTRSCTKYYGCAFHDFCMSWGNPLQRAFGPPIGFIEEYWDPRKLDATHKMTLEWRKE